MKANETPFLTFSLGAQHYALPVDDVIEVAAMVELINIPDASPELLGIADRHGVPLPILDLRRVFGQPPSPLTALSLFIVAVDENQAVGLVVDEVHQVEYIDTEELGYTIATGKYIRGIISHREHLMQIIALKSLLAAYISPSVKAGS